MVYGSLLAEATHRLAKVAWSHWQLSSPREPKGVLSSDLDLFEALRAAQGLACLASLGQPIGRLAGAIVSGNEERTEEVADALAWRLRAIQRSAIGADLQRLVPSLDLDLLSGSFKRVRAVQEPDSIDVWKHARLLLEHRSEALAILAQVHAIMASAVCGMSDQVRTLLATDQSFPPVIEPGVHALVGDILVVIRDLGSAGSFAGAYADAIVSGDREGIEDMGSWHRRELGMLEAQPWVDLLLALGAPALDLSGLRIAYDQVLVAARAGT